MSETNRRDFLGNLAGSAVGLAIAGWNRSHAQSQAPRPPANVRIGTGVPNISGIRGLVADRGSLTIDGSRFETKTNAAPLKYDDFEGATVGALPSTRGWDIAPGTHYPPLCSASRVRPCRTRSIQCRFPVPEYGSAVGLIDPSRGRYAGPGHSLGSGTEFYLDFWLYYPDPEEYGGGLRSRNWKLWWVDGAVDGCARIFNLYPDSVWSGGGGHYIGNGGSVWCNPSPVDLANRWTHFQSWATLSEVNVADGSLYLWHDGQATVSQNRNQCTRTINEVWTQIIVGQYYATDMGNGGNNIYLSDLYVDSTAARVEIGNNATYNGCTHREIQIPQTWSDGQIGVTLNRGSFGASELVYLFVVDRANRASPGYPVTFTG